MNSYKSTETRCYQEDTTYTFSTELIFYPGTHLPGKAVWEFKLWDTLLHSFAWKGTLEELAEVILAGQVALEQRRQLQEIVSRE